LFFTFNFILDYNTSQFNANKSIVITTSAPLGSSSFYGYLLIIGAIYCMLAILVLWILLITNREKKFDYSGLKWK
jgi:hypothetical protein